MAYFFDKALRTFVKAFASFTVGFLLDFENAFLIPLLKQ